MHPPKAPEAVADARTTAIRTERCSTGYQNVIKYTIPGKKPINVSRGFENQMWPHKHDAYRLQTFLYTVSALHSLSSWSQLTNEESQHDNRSIILYSRESDREHTPKTQQRPKPDGRADVALHNPVRWDFKQEVGQGEQRYRYCISSCRHVRLM
jgi:hypothetical protein